MGIGNKMKNGLMALFGRSQSRDAPTRESPNHTLQWLMDDNGFCCPRYTKLSESPEVRMGVERIADLVSSMTIYLMQNGDNGDVRIKNALSRKVDVEPSKFMNRQLWMSWIVKSMLINGNSIVLPTFKNGLIDDLIPIPNNKYRFLDLKNGGYKIEIGNKKYDYDEVLHFRINPKEDKPWKGESYKVVLSDVTENLKQAGHTTKEFMGSRMMPSLVVSVDAMSDELSNEEGRDRIKEKFLSSKAGEPWVIPSQLVKVDAIKPLTLNDIAIADNIKLGKETVAGILGIPAFLLGVGEFNREEFNNFVQTRIMVIAKAIEQELTAKLLYSPDYYFKFNIRSLYSYTLTELASVYTDLSTKGICTGNEVRDALSMSPLDGLDELKILENYIPLDRIGDQSKLNGGDDDGGDDSKSG